MEKLTFNLKNMKILQYEVGNMNKFKKNKTEVPKPVCALLLEDRASQRRVKVLLKNENAVSVDKYITQRRVLGSVEYEAIYLIAELREVRNNCVVVDNAREIYFDVCVGI